MYCWNNQIAHCIKSYMPLHRVKKFKCLFTVNCWSMPSVTVAVLTGLITIFRKKSWVISLSAEHSRGLLFSVLCGNGWANCPDYHFQYQKLVWLAVEIAHCPMYVAVAALIALSSSLEWNGYQQRKQQLYNGQFLTALNCTPKCTNGWLWLNITLVIWNKHNRQFIQ